MKIKFNSIEEMQTFFNAFSMNGQPRPAVSSPKPAEPKKSAPEKPPVEAPAQSDEDLKTEVRKLLAKVNKQTGKNTASEWIKDVTGREKLTEVDDEAQLKTLKAKAEEVLNG
jgi:hypothetical protein